MNYDYAMSCYGFPTNVISQYPGQRPNRILPNNSQGPCAGLGVINTDKYKMGALVVVGLVVGAVGLTLLSR